MKVSELRFWLEKMEKEGATELEVECIHHEEAYEKVKLSAIEPSGIVAESVMLIS